MTSRQPHVDAIRVIAIAAVVVGHVYDKGLVRELSYSWHVPFFFFATGYFWTAGRPLGQDIERRARTMVRPIVIWGAVSAGVYIAVYAATGVGTGWFPEPVLFPYWFLIAWVLTSVGLRALEPLPAAVPWVLAVAGLLVAWFTSVGLGASTWYVALSVPALIFVLVGRWYRRVEARVPVWAALVALVICGGLVLTGVSRPLDMKISDFGTPVLSVVVACLIAAGLVRLAQAAVPTSGRWSTAITQFAVAGFVVVLTHALLLYLLRDAGVPNAPKTLVTLVASWALGLAALRSPLAPALTGSPQQRTPRLSS